MREPTTPVNIHGCGCNMWLFASFLASVLFTVSAVIRGITSDYLMTTKGLLSVASFGTGLAYMIYAKLKKIVMDDTTPALPWSQPDRNPDGSPIPGTYRLRMNLVVCFLVRGLLEFSGSSLLLLTLKIALDNNMNQGISTSMMTMAGLMITLMSWCFFGEKLNWVHTLGILLILSSVIMMDLF